MTKYNKRIQGKTQFPSVDMSGRSRIVFDPVILIDDSGEERSIQTVRKYNYDFIMAGANPTKEERIRAFRKSILAYYHLIKPANKKSRPK